MKHTPGPWKWKEVALPGLGDDRWCEVLNPIIGPAIIRHESSSEPTPWKISPANARLIAAAPDLLAVLIELVTWLGPTSETEEAEKAIAKATGEML